MQEFDVSVFPLPLNLLALRATLCMWVVVERVGRIPVQMERRHKQWQNSTQSMRVLFLHDPFSMIHLASVARFSGGVIPNARGPANISHVSKGYVYYAGTWHHKYVCLLFVGNSLCSINGCNHAIRLSAAKWLRPSTLHSSIRASAARRQASRDRVMQQHSLQTWAKPISGHLQTKKGNRSGQGEESPGLMSPCSTMWCQILWLYEHVRRTETKPTWLTASLFIGKGNINVSLQIHIHRCS